MSVTRTSTVGPPGPAGHPPVVTTITGLPNAPADGQMALLRAGSSPYDFVGLVYDSTYGKWVSPAEEVVLSDNVTATTTSLTYTEVTGANLLRGFIRNFDDLIDAGLLPQFNLSALIAPDSAARTASLIVALYEINDGDTAGTAAGTSAEITRTGTTTLTQTGAEWTDCTFSPSPTEQHVQVRLEGKISSAGTASFARAYSRLRWVADPA